MEPFQPAEPKFVPIPRDFHSLENGGLFEKCLKCEIDLLHSEQPYLIERVFVQQEPIVEYAMCEACVLKSQGELSVESRQAVTSYMLANLDVGQRLERLSDWAESGSDDASELIPSADGDDHARRPCGPPRLGRDAPLRRHETLHLGFRYPVMTATGADGADRALVDPLLERRVADP